MGSEEARGLRDPRSRTRAADATWTGKVGNWWQEWGVAMVGFGLVLISAFLLVLAVQFYSSQASTKRLARQACVRSQTFGPALAKAYAHYHILSPAQLEAYRSGIPKSC